jgi:hypothetical protein
LKCGFHADNYGVFEKIKNNAPYVSGCEIEVWIKQCEHKAEKVWDYSIGKSFGNTTHISFIKYLHQLQNLYFALTGEELQINKL